MKAYDILFTELDRCEFIVDYEYKGELNDYTYNGISYSQSSAYYSNFLNNLYKDFLTEWCSLSEDEKKVVNSRMELILSKRFISGEFFFDVPTIKTIEGMKKDNVPARDIKMVYFICDMVAQQKFFLSQVNNFLNGNQQSNDEQLISSGKSNETAECLSLSHSDIGDNTQNLYQLLHEKYGDTMTVKQLCDFFQVTSRTVANWEQKGLVTNVSETSNEYTAIGHKKRGDEKRYLTYDIATNIELQRKFSRL